MRALVLITFKGRLVLNLACCSSRRVLLASFSESVCVVSVAMGVQRDVLTLANILAKVATGDELELVPIAESKLREAGHRTW